MSATLLAVVLVMVAAAAALNLALGAVWVAALLAVTWLRRRLRYAAWLVLLLAIAAGVGADRVGWLAPPPAASYAIDEAAWLRERFAGLGVRAGLARPPEPARLADGVAGLRARVAARRREELAQSGRQLEQRAVAAIAMSRDAGRLRSRAPADVTALEEAVRELALTLTAPEFRDLDAREARLAAWFSELESRLATARDQADLDAVARALEPAAMASVSLRALRDDLARVGVAAAAVVRALTAGGGVAVSATARLAYDEARGVLVEERRVTFEATPPLRLVRLDLGALREPPGPGLAVQALAYGVDGGEPRPMTAGTEAAPGDGGAARVVVLDRRERPLPAVTIGAALRPLAFVRVVVPAEPGPASDFPVRVRLAEAPDAGLLLVVAAGPPRLEEFRLPRHAFHHASRPGSVTTDADGDVWRPTDPGGASDPAGRPALTVEMVPARPLLRTGAFARLRPYLYTPNLATVLGAAALAALTSVIVRPRPRPRSPAPPAPAASPAGPG